MFQLIFAVVSIALVFGIATASCPSNSAPATVPCPPSVQPDLWSFMFLGFAIGLLAGSIGATILVRR